MVYVRQERQSVTDQLTITCELVDVECECVARE